MTDRLFLPLTAQAFGWWRSGAKKWEVRRDSPRWSLRHVYNGRPVELRLGYSGESLWGYVWGPPKPLSSAITLSASLDEILPGLAALDPQAQLVALYNAIGARSVQDLLTATAFRIVLEDDRVRLSGKAP